ncbi:hypothetical protein GH733_004855 [Mirounga leonina]|nr:hypothetical protein GH733_004855 [Mirounga leonina]
MGALWNPKMRYCPPPPSRTERSLEKNGGFGVDKDEEVICGPVHRKLEQVYVCEWHFTFRMAMSSLKIAQLLNGLIPLQQAPEAPAGQSELHRDLDTAQAASTLKRNKREVKFAAEVGVGAGLKAQALYQFVPILSVTMGRTSSPKLGSGWDEEIQAALLEISPTDGSASFSVVEASWRIKEDPWFAQ